MGAVALVPRTMVPGPRAGVGGPGAERGSPGPPASAHPQPPFQLSDLSAGWAHVWPGWRGPRKLCAGGDAAPACPTGRAAGGRKEEPSGKEPNCSPSLCLAGPHKGPAAGEAQLCGSWAGPNPTCPARGHIQAERWGQRHHARDPLRSGRGGCPSHAWGLPVTWEGHSPWTRTQPLGERLYEHFGQPVAAPTPKPAIKLEGTFQPQTHSQLGWASLTVPPLHSRALHLLPLGTLHTAHLRLVPTARLWLRAHVGSPHSSPARTLPSTKQPLRPPLAQRPPPGHTP